MTKDQLIKRLRGPRSSSDGVLEFPGSYLDEPSPIAMRRPSRTL